jgi:hypothetical protein
MSPRVVANIAKLPELVRKLTRRAPSGPWLENANER